MMQEFIGNSLVFIGGVCAFTYCTWGESRFLRAMNAGTLVLVGFGIAMTVIR